MFYLKHNFRLENSLNSFNKHKKDSPSLEKLFQGVSSHGLPFYDEKGCVLYGWRGQVHGLVVKALDPQSMRPVFKTTGWLHGRLRLY